MIQKLKVPSLLQLLRNAKDESGKFGPLPCEISEGTSGLKYLYNSVLLPLLNEQCVNTTDLDMDSFEREDIGKISDFFWNKLSNNSSEYRQLHQFYEKCAEAKAMPIEVDFL